MGERVVGRVEGLWRYPVKSMLGERIEQAVITERGICGDRAYALWDHVTGRVASAKNPLVWKGLLWFQARFVEPPQPAAPTPAAAIGVAGPEAGAASHAGPSRDAPLLSSDPAVSETLSQLLGRSVTLLDQAPERASLDQYWPDVKERAFQEVVNELELPRGSFFDSCSIHAITTATLERLRQLESQLDFAVERFRPNLLIAPAEGCGGFVEEGWIGHSLRIGDSLELRVDDGCPRCVVTTLALGGVPQEIEILRATARHNRVVAGIRLTVLTPGPVAVGDAVTLVE
jgi:uncharacterized protein YcbX